MLEVGGGVEEGEEDPTRRPGELVSERVVGAFGRREAAAVGEEVFDLGNDL